jgi:hypothetical protein
LLRSKKVQFVAGVIVILTVQNLCRLLGKDVKSKIGVSECATANAIIPFCLVPLVLTFDKESSSWGRDLYPFSPPKTAIIVFLLVSLSLAKNFDRAAKFGIVSTSSTIFFAGVDAFMKVVAGIGSFLFFGEIIQWNSYVGFILVVLALICLFIDKRNHMLSMKAEVDANAKISRTLSCEKRKISVVSAQSKDGPEEPFLQGELIVNTMVEQDKMWPIEELEVDNIEDYQGEDDEHSVTHFGSFADKGRTYSRLSTSEDVEAILSENPIHAEDGSSIQ